ncbi:glycosyltransferase family 2 protein [Gammaproteobacteria bacterium]|nr:glycosyltransferase family 2 protein [Gammaproteobacteria bacterium]
MTNLEVMYSAIVPIYNEEENLDEIARRLVQVLERIGPYEIVFVDDGSVDGSADIIGRLCGANPFVKAIHFSRNFGHQAAVSAGLRYASGDAVAVIDGDLQDPPELLPELFDKWREGYKVVYAIRQQRKEGLLKRAAYYLYYRLLRLIAEVEIPLDSGDFSVMDKVVVEKLNDMPESHRFIRGLRSWVGYSQVGVPYNRDARFAGEPKYTWSGLIRLGYDGIFSFSKVPLLIATRIGLFITLISVVGAFWTLGRKFILGVEPQGWTSLIIVVLLIGGIQLFVLGILGEYIGRIFEETKGRPTYIVSETKNIQHKVG